MLVNMMRSDSQMTYSSSLLLVVGLSSLIILKYFCTAANYDSGLYNSVHPIRDYHHTDKYDHKYSQMSPHGKMRFIWKCLKFKLEDKNAFHKKKCSSHQKFINQLHSSIADYVNGFEFSHPKANDPPHTTDQIEPDRPTTTPSNVADDPLREPDDRINFNKINDIPDLNESVYSSDNNDSGDDKPTDDLSSSMDESTTTEADDISDILKNSAGATQSCLDNMQKIFPSIPSTSPMIGRLCRSIADVIPILAKRLQSSTTNSERAKIFCETLVNGLIDNIPSVMGSVLQKTCKLLDEVTKPTDAPFRYSRQRQQRQQQQPIENATTTKGPWKKLFDIIKVRPSQPPFIITKEVALPGKKVYAIEIAICNRLEDIMDALSLPQFIVGPVDTVCQFIQDGINNAINRPGTIFERPKRFEDEVAEKMEKAVEEESKKNLYYDY